MSKGYVYILTNESMPGLVKIGKTTRTPEQRVSELQATGVPTPFKVIDSAYSPDCDELERNMHVEFGHSRVNPDREFFRVCCKLASERLHLILRLQIEGFVADYIPDGSVVDHDMSVNPVWIAKISEESGVCPPDVAHAIHYLRPEEVKILNDRRQAHLLEMRAEKTAPQLTVVQVEAAE